MMIKRASAAVAVTAFGIALGAGSAFAADSVPCGTPAVEAVYSTVVVAGSPAVTHTETQWSRTTIPVLYEWERYVVTRPAQEAVYDTITIPAVYETVVVTPYQPGYWDEQEVEQEYTEYEFIFRPGQQGERTRWEEDPNWNANGNNNSNGWTSTGATRTATRTVTEEVWVPEVEEVTQEVLVEPAREETVLVSPAVEEEGEYQKTWSATSPGAEWEQTGETEQGEPTVELRWAVASPGEGWVDTGQTRTVTDKEAVPDTTTQVLVSPAVPAGDPCPVTVTPVKPATNPPVVAAPTTEAPTTEAPTTEAPTTAAPAIPAATQTQVKELAYTGSDLTLLWLGAGTLLAGMGASAAYRKAARNA
jgi:hypothetical protein